jgi:hypothetical protein
MARGELSFSKVRAITRVATTENETDLLELARGCTTAQLERMVRAYRLGSRRDEAEWEQRRHDSRTLSIFPDDDGMYVVKGRLPAEVGALLMRAVEAASDALYREKTGPWHPAAVREREAARLRADALGLLAERAMAAGFGGRLRETAVVGIGPGGGAFRRAEGEDGPESEGAVDADSTVAASVPISGTRAERYQVVLHVEAGTLQAGKNRFDTEPRRSDLEPGHSEPEDGRSELEDGTHLAPRLRSANSGTASVERFPQLDDGSVVSAETSRRLSCDAGVVRITHAPDGSILDVGRRTRTILPALRRALEARDGGCRFPGCGLRFTDAHHVKHWADGGKTMLGNVLLLCRFHHRLVHEGGWRVGWQDTGAPVFMDPRGGFHYDGRWTWPEGMGDRTAEEGSAEYGAAAGSGGNGPGPQKSPVEALVDENRRRGVRPGFHTAGARWEREADIPRGVYFRALEALGEALL